MQGGVLDRGSSRFDPKRGQREVAGDFNAVGTSLASRRVARSGEVPEPDSEGTVFESSGWSSSRPLRSCFQITENFHVRLDQGMEIRVTPCAVTLLASRDSISFPCCVPRKQSRQGKTKSGRTPRSAVPVPNGPGLFLETGDEFYPTQFSRVPA